MTYMFVFSVALLDTKDEDGLSSIPEKFYSSLDEIPGFEHMFARVYPVKFKGSDYRLYSERIRFVGGNWNPDEVEWNESWLRIIMADPVEGPEIRQMDVSKIVIYNEMAFQSQGDLIDYLTERGEIKVVHLHNVTTHSEERPTSNCEGRTGALNDSLSVTDKVGHLYHELRPYPSPPTERSSLYWDEKRRLDQELDQYHRDHHCTKC